MRRNDHSSRGILSTVVCDQETSTRGGYGPATGLQNTNPQWVVGPVERKIKQFTATHSYLAHYFNQFTEYAGNIPHFLVQAITYLLPRNGDCQDPSKYRPITCLCTIYKIYTACIFEKIYKHLETNKLLAEEQNGCIKNSQGCKEQLIIDSVLLEQAHEDKENLYIAYTDYHKAFDSVPHSWLIRVLEIYKIDPLIINSIQQLMKNQTTRLQVKVKNNQITSESFRIQRGIYQGDSLSALWFCLTLNPLSHLLKRTNYDFGIHSNNQVIQRLNYLLYMDDINTFTAIVDLSRFNNACLKSPASTLVDLTFQLRALRSFSLNQLCNLSLQAGNLHSSFSISS